MSHAYITYFDKNYLIKGLAMLDSLEKHDPGRTLTVICLDDDTFQILTKLARPGVMPVRLATVETGDNALAEARGNRSRVEYYWTLTPTAILRFLERMPDNETLTYVDADLLFFSPLQTVFDELGAASVLIHKHNFPPRYAAFDVNGVYNVGLLTFRNAPEGIKVLSWWRDRCLEWCYHRCEDGKMGDQKYLESFASLTDSLIVSQNPGVGVAPWNHIGYRLSERDGIPCVDGVPTVFFHYHAAAHAVPGCLAPVTDGSYICTMDMLRLYALPYLEALDAAFDVIRGVAPGFSHGFNQDSITAAMCLVVRNGQFGTLGEVYPCIVPLQGEYSVCVAPQLAGSERLCGHTIRAGGLSWSGNYADWKSAVAASGGYDEAGIFSKTRDAARAVRDGKALWERDSVLFNTPEVNWPLLASLMTVAARSGNRLHVLDFGGAFGSTFMQHRNALSGLKVCSWHVVEQEHFVRCGQEEFSTETLRFHATVEEALAAAPINVILLSSVLQYLEAPYALLKKLAATGIAIVVDRTPVLEDRERITVQRVPAEIYSASYACRWLDKRRLGGILERAGYALSPWFPSAVDPQGFMGVFADRAGKADRADSPTRKDNLAGANRARNKERGPAPTTPTRGEHIQEGSSPLRIMQVDDFYPGYLNAFYGSRPGLAQKSSAEQGEALFRDGFSAVHAVVPYLRDKGCETDYFASSALPLQRAWAREHGVPFPADERIWDLEMVRRRVEHFRPDVLYLADPLRYNSRFLRALSFKPRLVVGWKAADVPFGTDWKGYDVILSNVPRILALAESLGAKRGVRFHPGMPKWIADHVAAIPQDTDVCFVGSLFSGQHAARAALLDGVARAAAQHGFSLALHLSGDERAVTPAMRPYLRPPAFGLGMHEALRRGKIVVNTGGTVSFVMPNGERKMDLGGDDVINMRLFEATGGGSLVLTENMAGTIKYFEPGREVVTYQGEAQLIDTLLHYLTHEDERSVIAEAGRQRCLTEHSMEKAAAWFLRIIRESLSNSF